jgi:hypothetical protein
LTLPSPLALELRRLLAAALVADYRQEMRQKTNDCEATVTSLSARNRVPGEASG